MNKIHQLYTTDQNNIDTNGTSLQGYTTPVSFNELVSVFGQPTYLYDDKVLCEWQVKYLKDGSVATIYMYKWFPFGKLDKKLQWHIGGYDKRTANRVNKTLKEKLKYFKSLGLK